MTAALLALALVMALVLLMFAWARINVLLARVEALEAEPVEAHDKCVSQIAALIGPWRAAEVLRSAADEYDSIRERHIIERIRSSYTLDGPSVPHQWLMQRANDIEARG